MKERQGDPGYHLLAGGRDALEVTIDYRLPLHMWPARLNRAFGIGGYVAAIAVVAAVLVAFPLFALVAVGFDGAWLSLLGVLGAVPAIDAAVALVNRGVTWGFGATLLPALELGKGVPAHLRTLVAVPTLLTTAEAVEEQIERLEIHHLASPDGDLHFALLSDWTDATTEQAEGDEALFAAAVDGVHRLNRRYGSAPGGPRFLLLHRRRVWNEGEGRWIGWERKRGKLHELNRLLRGATDTTFVATDGDVMLPPANIRYVVTLDADTRLPRDTVRRLIGKMAHPLNRPRFDSLAGRVVEGYAVLQPRVTPSLPVGRQGSVFQRIFSSVSGIDPYASAVSDVYQDLFGEGSYTGKGIYDVDAFEAALAGRVPDSTLLSHDLFEGIFARAGLASDVEVVEEFPARYDARRATPSPLGARRLAALAVDFGERTEGRKRGPNAESHTSDRPLEDARQSPAHTVCACGRSRSVDRMGAAIPRRTYLDGIRARDDRGADPNLRHRRRRASAFRHLNAQPYSRASAPILRLALTLSALIVIFLAHQAWLMGDAIARTLCRLFVTRRHLLEWVAAAQATTGSDSGFF